MKRIYIAGKVTGEDYAECFKKFWDAETKLTEQGMAVVNPMKIVPKEADWVKAMRICISELMKCDCIYLLPDWKQSKGAKKEFNLALEYKIPILSNLNL